LLRSYTTHPSKHGSVTREMVSTGGPEDPRMAVIEVVPDEIRHYHQERSGLGVLGEVVAATITGNTASPGSIRTITREELATVA
jgi:hypothetical protein